VWWLGALRTPIGRQTGTGAKEKGREGTAGAAAAIARAPKDLPQEKKTRN
jgi:hypothetical protein